MRLTDDIRKAVEATLHREVPDGDILAAHRQYAGQPTWSLCRRLMELEGAGGDGEHSGEIEALRIAIAVRDVTEK